MRNVCVAGDCSNGSNSILIRRCGKKRSVETSNHYGTNTVHITVTVSELWGSCWMLLFQKIPLKYRERKQKWY